MGVDGRYGNRKDTIVGCSPKYSVSIIGNVCDVVGTKSVSLSNLIDDITGLIGDIETFTCGRNSTKPVLELLYLGDVMFSPQGRKT